MESLPQNKLNFLKPQSIREWLGHFSSVQQFMILLAGFVILILTQFILGFSMLIWMSYRVESTSHNIHRDIQSVSRLKGELAELKLLYREKYSKLTQKSAANQLATLQKELLKLELFQKGQRNEAGIRLKKLAQLTNRSFNYQTYQLARQEVQKLQTLLVKAEKDLHNRNNTVVTALTGTLLILVLLLSVGGFILWAWIAIQVVNEHQQALDYYQEISHKFKQNQIERDLKKFRSTELMELQAALNRYFENLRTRYREVRTYTNELFDELKALHDSTKQNDTFSLALRESLQELINKTHYKLDTFPNLAERVKFLNQSLQESGNQAAALQDSLAQAGEVIKVGSSEVNRLNSKLDLRANNSAQIVASLKQLRVMMDQLQQIVTVFEGLTEQTSVLSLNAAIEAARAGTAGDGFDIAATEIGELADRIGKIPHELLLLLNKEKKQTEQAIHTYEGLLPQNNQVKQYLAAFETQLAAFWEKFSVMLEQIQEFESLVHQYEVRRLSLEELTGFLAELNRRIPEDYSKAATALDAVDKPDHFPLSMSELENLVIEVNQLLAKMEN